jgi:spermidine synthase
METAFSKEVRMTDEKWAEERYGEGGAITRLGYKAGRTRVRTQSEFQTIEVVETEVAGAVLLLDGAFMTSTAHEHFYHEMLAHPALADAARIERVLIIGGGDGGTVREVLKYPEVKSVTLCEIDRGVIDACRAHLPEMNVPWDDPRLHISCGDGMAFVADASNGKFDVILVDGADPVGPAAVLFSPEFYARCKRRLADGGIIASQTESPIAMREDFLRIVKTMRATFRIADPYFGPMPIYPSGTWSWTLAYDGSTRLPDPHRVAHAEQTCRYFNRQIARSAFALPQDILMALRRRGSVH